MAPGYGDACSMETLLLAMKKAILADETYLPDVGTVAITIGRLPVSFNHPMIALEPQNSPETKLGERASERHVWATHNVRLYVALYSADAPHNEDDIVGSEHGPGIIPLANRTIELLGRNLLGPLAGLDANRPPMAKPLEGNPYSQSRLKREGGDVWALLSAIDYQAYTVAFIR